LTVSGARIVFVVRPELRRWNFGPEERLSIVARGESIPAFDSWIGLESLPLVTRTPFPPAAGSSREAQDVQLVGICWRGDPNAGADSKRSTPLSLWRRLLQMPGLHFRSLQYGACPDQGPD